MSDAMQAEMQARLERSHSMYDIEIASVSPHLSKGALVIFDVIPKPDTRLQRYQRVAFFRRGETQLSLVWDMMAE